MIELHRLPAEIRESRRAVLWNYEERGGKPTKVPYVPGQPEKRASSTDSNTWGTFDEAHAAYMEGKADGVGHVLGEKISGVDLDHCRDPQTGLIEAWALDIIRLLDSYTEASPSGTGVKVFLGGTLPPGCRRKGKIELYDCARFFTVTGDHVPGTPETIEERTAQLAELHARIFAANGGGRRRAVSRPASPLSDDDAALLERARGAKNGDKFSGLWSGDTSGHASPSEADLALCDLLAFWTAKDADRMDALFRQSGLMRKKWDERHGAQTYGAMTIATAIAGCQETYSGPTRTGTPEAKPGASEAEPTQDATSLILDPADPLPSARAFVARSHILQDTLALRHQSGVFYTYDAERKTYAERDEAAIRAELYGFLESAQRRTEPGGNHPPALGPFKPTKSRVENVADALRAVCNLPASSVPPCWLQDDPGLDPFDILACRNGLLHLPTRRLLPGTPAFYTLTGLDFAFDPYAPAPIRWGQFLAELWPDDPECRDTLQEVFGYCLTPQTHYQKVFMLVGPKRSGKGTIGRVLRRLLGDRNVCGPMFANMGEPFGLSILIGKSLAIIADARISGRTDTAVLTERLLSISGEDTLSIPRKYLPDWTGKLSTRFLLLTNELPRIEDASGALASRFIVLTLTQSFYGREDHGLFERLLPELPGILNWALAGWDRLYTRGHFVQPHSSTELIQQLEDLGSPVGAFVRERCEIGPGFEVAQAALFEAWKGWCQENGRERPGTTQTLGRNLRAAYPWLQDTRPLVGGERVRKWRGLRLLDSG
jgi:putative DNA primase/helicase